MIFPPEIWECIFVYIDPITLMNLKTICKCWREIIDKILKQTALWYKLCKDEIPEHFWTTLCETLSPNKFYTNYEKDDAKFWMAMYKLWVKCKNITKCNVTQMKCVEPLLKNYSRQYVTCIDTSGSLLAVGTSEGFIHFYDICNFHADAKHIVDHMEYVKSVQFLRDETDTVCISCSVNKHINFWDVNTLMPINRSHGKLICTSYSYCYIAMYNKISIEGSVPKTTYEFDSHNIIAIGADNNKVLFYTEGGYYVHLTLDAGEINYSYTHVPPPKVRIVRYYIFRPNIITCITERGYLGFLIQGKEWKMYNIFPSLHATPTAILIYAHVLILGMESGNVHLYYIKDFGAINFDLINPKTLTLDSTAVVSLNIMVHIEVYLIVAYSKKIYIVKFT